MSEAQQIQETSLPSNESSESSKTIRKEKKEKKVKKEHKEHKEHKEKKEHRERRDTKTKDTSEAVPQQESSEPHSEKESAPSEQPEPGLRRWASRKNTLGQQPGNSAQSYKELVAERELIQRKREQMSDMGWWTKPSQTEILKEGSAEFGTVKDGSKKSWDKRWLVLTSRNLLVYKTKKSDTPICAIVLFSGKVEENTDDKSKKFVSRIQSIRSFTQDTINHEREYFFSFETQEEYKEWSEKLFYTCRSAIDPESSISTKPRTESESHIEHDQGWFEKTETGKLAEPARPSSVPPRTSLDANSAAATDGKQGWTGSVTETIRNSLSIRSKKNPTDVRGTFRDSSSPRDSLSSNNSSSLVPATVVRQPVVIRPALYYNNLVGVSNGVVMLCLENNIEVEKNYVHISWIIQSYTSNTANAGTPSSPKKGFKPRFLSVSPNNVLPAFANANNDAVVGFSSVFKHLCSEYKVSPHWYPEEKKKRDQIDEILDTWGFNKTVLEAMKSVLFDRIVDPTSTVAQYSFRNTLKDIGRLVSRVDSELGSNKFLSGSEPSIADLAIAGDILLLRFLSGHLDMSKYAHIKRWQSDLSNIVKSYTSVVSEFEAVVKELAIEGIS